MAQQAMKRNIVVICLDSVRKDYFDKNSTKLNSIANVNYRNCRAASSWSVPSHASLFTGQLPHQHQVHAGNFDFTGIDESDTFLSHLKEYKKIGVSANKYISPSFGFDQLFDEFVEIDSRYLYPEATTPADIDTDHDSVFNSYLRYIKSSVLSDKKMKSIANGFYGQTKSYIDDLPIRRPLDDGAKSIVKSSLSEIVSTESPTFLFINFMDAHIPHQNTWGYDQTKYTIPNDWSSKEYSKWDIMLKNKHDEKYIDIFREAYSAAIEYLDRQVYNFINEIQKRSQRETVFIITADHGENIGHDAEEGLFDHTSSLSEGLLHVPLLVVDPSVDQKCEEKLVTHLDLSDLILSIYNNEGVNMRGRELIPAEVIGLSGQGIQKYDVSSEDFKYWNRMIRCVYQDTTKTVWDSLGNIQKYKIDYERDCWQDNMGSKSKLNDQYRALFDIAIEEYKSSTNRADMQEIDKATADRLQELGYL